MLQKFMIKLVWLLTLIFALAFRVWKRHTGHEIASKASASTMPKHPLKVDPPIVCTR